MVRLRGIFVVAVVAAVSAFCAPTSADVPLGEGKCLTLVNSTTPEFRNVSYTCVSCSRPPAHRRRPSHGPGSGDNEHWEVPQCTTRTCYRLVRRYQNYVRHRIACCDGYTAAEYNRCVPITASGGWTTPRWDDAPPRGSEHTPPSPIPGYPPEPEPTPWWGSEHTTPFPIPGQPPEPEPTPRRGSEHTPPPPIPGRPPGPEPTPRSPPGDSPRGPIHGNGSPRTSDTPTRRSFVALALGIAIPLIGLLIVAVAVALLLCLRRTAAAVAATAARVSVPVAGLSPSAPYANPYVVHLPGSPRAVADVKATETAAYDNHIYTEAWGDTGAHAYDNKQQQVYDNKQQQVYNNNVGDGDKNKPIYMEIV